MTELDKPKPESSQGQEKAKRKWHPLVKLLVFLFALAVAYGLGSGQMQSMHGDHRLAVQLIEMLFLVPAAAGLSLIVAAVCAFFGPRCQIVTQRALAVTILLIAFEAGLWQVLG